MVHPQNAVGMDRPAGADHRARRVHMAAGMAVERQNPGRMGVARVVAVVVRNRPSRDARGPVVKVDPGLQDRASTVGHYRARRGRLTTCDRGNCADSLTVFFLGGIRNPGVP